MPAYPLGPEISLGQLHGSRADIPPNSLLSGLQIGKGEDVDDHWLQAYYRTLTQLGERNLELADPELALPTITAPASNGASGTVHVPDGCIVTALQFGGESLSVFYKRVQYPPELTFGPEQQSLWTKEARSGGGGVIAEALGCMLTGFQLHKDPDKTLSLQIWFKALT